MIWHLIRFTHTAHDMASSDSPTRLRLWHRQIHPHGQRIVRFTHTASASSDSPTRLRLWHRQIHPHGSGYGIIRFTHTASASSDSPTRLRLWHHQFHQHDTGVRGRRLGYLNGLSASIGSTKRTSWRVVRAGRCSDFAFAARWASVTAGRLARASCDCQTARRTV